MVGLLIVSRANAESSSDDSRSRMDRLQKMIEGLDRRVEHLETARGKLLYEQSCSVCNGVDGRGFPDLGGDLVHGTFAVGKTDDQLVEFIKQGRPLADPLNTTGIPMPPRAGNPSLTDDQIRDIVGYLRTLEQK
jgi:mono/diheme cytochrome c family protein